VLILYKRVQRELKKQNTKGDDMVKQDQNRTSLPNDGKKHINPPSQSSHKEKNGDKQQAKNSEGAMQGTDSQDEKRKEMSQKKHPSRGFDHNEGEQRSQKS
jgi:hypothetical protein